MHLQESGEMYLETIYMLSQQQNIVRAIDVGEHMGYSKPSVSRAVGLLKKSGYIVVSKEGYITLTDAGTDVAMKIYERHTILSCMLTLLGVSPETAAEDAHSFGDVNACHQSACQCGDLEFLKELDLDAPEGGITKHLADQCA